MPTLCRGIKWPALILPLTKCPTPAVKVSWSNCNALHSPGPHPIPFSPGAASPQLSLHGSIPNPLLVGRGCVIQDWPYWWYLLEQREEQKKGVKQEATQAGGWLQYLRSSAGEGAIRRWGSLERQLSVLGCRWALPPALSREQQEQLLWQCWDQASFRSMGISITSGSRWCGRGVGMEDTGSASRRRQLSSQETRLLCSGGKKGCKGFSV